MKGYKIKRGRHWSWPRTPRLFREPLMEVSAIIHDVYEPPVECPLSWNKLTGFTQCALRPSHTALMVAWRYNIKDDVYEIAPYANSHGSIIFPRESDIIQVKAGHPFFARFEIIDGDVALQLKTLYSEWGKPHRLNTLRMKWLWRIQPWFGGRCKSPTDISITLNTY